MIEFFEQAQSYEPSEQEPFLDYPFRNQRRKYTDYIDARSYLKIGSHVAEYDLGALGTTRKFVTFLIGQKAGS